MMTIGIIQTVLAIVVLVAVCIYAERKVKRQREWDRQHGRPH